VEKGLSRLGLSLGCICTGLWVSLGRGSLHVVAAGSATRGVRAHRNALGSRDVAVAGGVRHRLAVRPIQVVHAGVADPIAGRLVVHIVVDPRLVLIVRERATGQNYKIIH